MRARLWLLAVVLASGAAWAQQEPLPGRLYLNPGILLNPARMVALGGAYTGIGETAYGFSSNLAAIARRTATENGAWNLSPIFT
ncbi:MAG: hypothetical protein IRZ16_06040 [Myxococcaceae bacterium]|nr:hypothetical protein [Myxococcaceae bacterium]